MKRIALVWLAVAFLWMKCVPSLLAGTILGDGGVHSVSGPAPEILLQNGTTLNILSGTVISGPSMTDGIAGDSSPNHITVTSGVNNGGSNAASFAGFANSGIKMQGGTLNISGGEFRGGDASFSPGSGVDTRNTSVNISGGTFYAGNITTAGYAGNGFQASGGEILISGGTFNGGARSDGFASGGAALFGNDGAWIPTHVVITGGTFTSDGLMQLGAFSLGVGVAEVDLMGGHISGHLSQRLQRLAARHLRHGIDDDRVDVQ